jgi:hypothetical protein
MVKATGNPSAEQVAKAERQRLAKEDGARAIDDVARSAAAIRKNMARLRELRLAKEAQEPASSPKGKSAPSRRPGSTKA